VPYNTALGGSAVVAVGGLIAGIVVGTGSSRPTV
jgi:hypothetical protein